MKKLRDALFSRGSKFPREAMQDDYPVNFWKTEKNVATDWKIDVESKVDALETQLAELSLMMHKG